MQKTGDPSFKGEGAFHPSRLFDQRYFEGFAESQVSPGVNFISILLATFVYEKA